MYSLIVRNASDALSKGLSTLSVNGEVETSRNGSVLVLPDPVMTTYWAPEERVVFSPARNANPFFHLFESLWMLAGRNDLDYLAQFLPRYKDYSDDGKTAHGAYGYRWRHFFGFDQLEAAVFELKKNPNSRRVVISMWDGGVETAKFANDFCYGDPAAVLLGGKDVPCNTHIYLDRRNNRLNMTVCCRSNDAVWGAYGANVVHFSFLMEYLAAAIGCPMGEMRQFSNNFHAYMDRYPPETLRKIAMESAQDVFLYENGSVKRLPLVQHPGLFLHQVEQFCEGRTGGINEPFLTQVAIPLKEVWDRRNEPWESTRYIFAELDPAVDWVRAAWEWMVRREAKKEGK